MLLRQEISWALEISCSNNLRYLLLEIYFLSVFVYAFQKFNISMQILSSVFSMLVSNSTAILKCLKSFWMLISMAVFPWVCKKNTCMDKFWEFILSQCRAPSVKIKGRWFEIHFVLPHVIQCIYLTKETLVMFIWYCYDTLQTRKIKQTDKLWHLR